MAPSAIEIDIEKTLIPAFEKELVTDIDFDHGGTPTTLNSQRLIKQAFEKHLATLTSDPESNDDAFFVADLGEVYRQHLRWKQRLPRITPFYAVKCNPDRKVLELLSRLGTGFDCASKAEIQQVLELGVDPARIVYAHPCKTRSYVSFAASRHVSQMTFDNIDELLKIKELYPAAALLLRIMTDDSGSLCRLSQKFGASLDDTKELLEVAKRLELNVIGVSFHVGSGASDPAAFVKAVQDARFVFDQAEKVGFRPDVLDVGGGFSNDTFELMAGALSAAVDQYIPASVRVIAEPGRYYVATAFTAAANVIARRELEDPVSGLASYMLYLNDGVYGNFSCIIFDHQQPVPQVLQASNHVHYGEAAQCRSSTGLIRYSLWGPTCDGIDIVSENCAFPQVLSVGDWLYFNDMGAYTRCSATKFNGFTDSHEVIYISSELGASALLRDVL